MLNFLSKTLLVGTLMAASTAGFAQRQEISNDLSKCSLGASGPAVMVKVSGFKSLTGRVRVQSYAADKDKWLKSGKWINRIDTPISTKSDVMSFCMPVPSAGNYGIAVRHDINGDGSSGWNDGGGFSNNPDISLLNLKPSVNKSKITVGRGVTRISVVLNYRQGTSIEPIG